MAHDAIQDLLDKVWFGGIEPTSSYLSIGLCTICPLLVPFFMTASKDKMIDRIGYWASGACYGYGQSRMHESVPESVEVYIMHFLYLVSNFILFFKF